MTGNGEQLLGTFFADDAGIAPACPLPRDDAAFADARRQLHEYFAGERQSFDLRLAPTGPLFAMRVWAALTQIPYGETASYGDIAERIGRPGAARAVGSANHVNPLPIVVPCHRVIGADGSMVGFGGGMERKHILLGVEAQTLF
ncbi:methylated-DNA--[protein]-cysteine S-methyltransferase [Nakamurella sp. YIM 132087]|uniref:methylated-DNA--[protein]-cysteine S-methyltransferase n=2 Tax=Nakamurella alba TaxID=2665158 RepID=A0A7K1FMH2_9ACTN|nr:methylated-DNA--[protein]-cysteine S-methyltransferase [Nakamurella alba]